MERVRRRLRLSDDGSPSEALQTITTLPGVSRATLDGRDLVVDLEPDVLSDDEIEAAVERGGSRVVGWDDETRPAPDATARTSDDAGGVTDPESTATPGDAGAGRVQTE